MSTRGVFVKVGLLIALAAALIGTLIARSRSVPHYAQPPIGVIRSTELVELSGIVRAPVEHQFWGHNDSGHPPAIFRFDESGHVHQRVDVSGAVNIDWEGMTSDGRGGLFIGDFGDNALRRLDFTIYHIAPPDLADHGAVVLAARRFAYPDKQPRNCEAMFLLGGRLYLIGKYNSPRFTSTVFCVDDYDDAPDLVAADEAAAQLRKVGELSVRGQVTDAAYSAERHQLAVLSYTGVSFYAVETERDLADPPTQRIRVFFDQCEGLCFDGDDVIVTNEAGAIWRLQAP